jgi:hypothetical protein
MTFVPKELVLVAALNTATMITCVLMILAMSTLVIAFTLIIVLLVPTIMLVLAPICATKVFVFLVTPPTATMEMCVLMIHVMPIRVNVFIRIILPPVQTTTPVQWMTFVTKEYAHLAAPLSVTIVMFVPMTIATGPLGIVRMLITPLLVLTAMLVHVRTFVIMVLAFLAHLQTVTTETCVLTTRAIVTQDFVAIQITKPLVPMVTFVQ